MSLRAQSSYRRRAVAPSLAGAAVSDLSVAMTSRSRAQGHRRLWGRNERHAASHSCARPPLHLAAAPSRTGPPKPLNHRTLTPAARGRRLQNAVVPFNAGPTSHCRATTPSLAEPRVPEHHRAQDHCPDLTPSFIEPLAPPHTGSLSRRCATAAPSHAGPPMSTSRRTASSTRPVAVATSVAGPTAHYRKWGYSR